jgi:hypothetical protein
VVDPSCRRVNHSTNPYIFPALPWIDAVLDGERDWNLDATDRDWIDYYPKERMRSLSVAHNWGVGICWMSNFTSSDKVKLCEQKTRQSDRLEVPAMGAGVVLPLPGNRQFVTADGHEVEGIVALDSQRHQGIGNGIVVPDHGEAGAPFEPRQAEIEIVLVDVRVPANPEQWFRQRQVFATPRVCPPSPGRPW